MIETVIMIITAVVNIAAIVLNACKLTAIAEVLYQILPELNTIAVAVLWFLGYKDRKALAEGGK